MWVYLSINTTTTTTSWDFLDNSGVICFVWPFFSLVFFLILFCLIPLLSGGIMFSYLIGASVLHFLCLSFCIWGSSLLGWFLSLLCVHSVNINTILLVFVFNAFVNTLRPITLTLRVVINVSLGHALIEAVLSLLFWVVYIVLCLELFVYIVQSYVFLMLSKSYCDEL